VGLIAAYHALQAGIEVVGLVEAMPHVGGYKVHQDKILRLGIPVWTSHTVKCVNGKNKVESVTVVRVNGRFNPIPDTEKTYLADTVLIAVGLNPVNELFDQAREFGMDVYSAGDALEIAEASAAIFSGRIAGREIAKSLSKSVSIPSDWYKRWEILKSKPGRSVPVEIRPLESGVFPVIRCVQEIPCDPCIHICPKDMIKMPEDEIFGLPEVVKDECTGCNLCVAVCPGLAITLVDARGAGSDALVTVPFELLELTVRVGDEVEAVDMDGEFVTKAKVEKMIKRKAYDRTILVSLRVPKEEAVKVAGFKIQDPKISQPIEPSSRPCIDDETIICRCERVKAKEIKELIRQGIKDMNQLKVLRCGMGSCGAKTCQPLILKLYQQEGIELCEVIPFTQRPLLAEVSLGTLAGEKSS
jgi:Fe-S-cluster-containing hydrogenase component 2/bacterioferritin-associated ferredoxin